MAGFIKFPSFIRVNSPKKFNYKPLYYDADKEHLKFRIESISRELKKENQETLNSGNSDLKGRIREKWQMNSRRVENKKSNIRVLVIAFLLSIIAWYFLIKP